MATLSPILPNPLASHSYHHLSAMHLNDSGSGRSSSNSDSSANSHRYPGPPSPSYFAMSPSYHSPTREQHSAQSPSTQIRLPPLRSIQTLPPITTLTEPPSRQSLSPYEHFSNSSYFGNGPQSPFSPHHAVTPPIPSPMSDSHRPVNKKGPWTKAEDEMLIFHVTSQQKSSMAHATHWGDVSKLMGEMRNAKQCRERYTQNLAPGLNRQPITDAEATFIREWVGKNGTQWAELSRQPEVRGRSDNHLKNWWNGQRKQLEDRDRALRKANVRRTSHQSIAQRASASPLDGQSALPAYQETVSARSSLSPALPQQTNPAPALSTLPSSAQRISMANILN